MSPSQLFFSLFISLPISKIPGESRNSYPVMQILLMWTAHAICVVISVGELELRKTIKGTMSVTLNLLLV